MNQLELNQTFVIEAPPNIGGGYGCDNIIIDSVMSCSGDTIIKLSTDNVSINQTLLPATALVDLGTTVKRFRSINTVSGTSTYWTTNIIRSAVINAEAINLGSDILNNNRVITANTALLIGDSLGGQVY